MKRLSVVLIVGFLVPALFAKGKPNPADYPLKAHVVAIGSTRSGGGSTSSYDAQTGRYSYGEADSVRRYFVRFRIEKMIYTTGRNCRKLAVGQDVHVRIAGKHMFVLSDEGVNCKTEITSVEELP